MWKKLFKKSYPTIEEPIKSKIIDWSEYDEKENIGQKPHCCVAPTVIYKKSGVTLVPKPQKYKPMLLMIQLVRL